MIFNRETLGEKKSEGGCGEALVGKVIDILLQIVMLNGIRGPKSPG